MKYKDGACLDITPNPRNKGGKTNNFLSFLSAKIKR